MLSQELHVPSLQKINLPYFIHETALIISYQDHIQRFMNFLWKTAPLKFKTVIAEITCWNN